jgi:5'-nucleotidase-like protein/3-keto-disaccharide hydrolase
MNALSRPVRAAVVVLAVALSTLAGPGAQSSAAATGDDVIAWVEVEDGEITGGPAFNSGDHGNFSGTGSYTFRETGMTSTMTVTAPAAGVYPVYVRYAAGPLGPDENVTRSMGLLTNGGNRQLMSLPMTSFDDWETWRFVEYDVTLVQGANTIAIQCNRSTDFCRLNFDAIQVGGTAADPCPAVGADPGWTSMFDGTFATFDQWRKAGAGGFGRQTDCYIRGFGGQGATWFTQQLSGSYTVRLDWRRRATDRQSSVYVASTSRSGADPVGGFRIPIGTGTGSIVPTGGTTKAADASAVAAALKPIGQWNTYTIQVTPSRLRVLLNGTVVNTLERPGTIATTGFVGLENRAAGAVEFADIQLLSDIELGTVAASARRADGESSLANLLAEAQRRATGASIALVHPDSLGADLLGRDGGYPAAVTRTEAATVQPSSDTLVTMHLTGQQLRSVLEERELGTSAGFAYTYDPTAAPGQRVTGMWLDGTPIDPAAGYAVAATAAVTTLGTDRVDTGLTGLDALASYLESGGVVTPDVTQHGVGVAFPGGKPASYLPGDALAVDLSSLAFSASEPRDAAVQVVLGGRDLGGFPVDEQGWAAVRAAVPVDLAAGPALLTLTGGTTGTTVRVPVTIAARPPASTPPVPTVPPVVQKATPEVAVTAQPRRVVAGRTKPVLTVAVSATGRTPTGTVKVKVGARTYVAQLRNGKAVVRLAKVRKPGTIRATASYLGDAQVAPASGTVRIKVVKARRR